MFWIIPFALVVLALLYHFKPRRRIHRNGQQLRHPPDTLPIFGNAIRFLQPRTALFNWFLQCQKRFGLETYEISVPTLPTGVVISDPEILEFVLKNENTITKGEFFKRRSWDLFGYGIINATGDLWKAQRKAGLKFFSGANLDVLIEEVMPEIYQQTHVELSRHSDSGQVCDLQKVLLDLTTRAVGQMAYDMDIDASSPFTKAFDYASDHVGLRFQNPLYFITELFTGAKLRSSIIEVKKFGRQIVRNARKRRSQAAFESLITNDEVVFGSLIDSLMEVFPNPTIVADAALNFLSAGRDTTAQSLTWTFYLLMRHPSALDFIRDEVDSLSSHDNSTTSSTVTVSGLQPGQIPRLTALFYESLRLHPPVPFELKQTTQPITLPDSTFLPSGSIVLWCIWALNRSSVLYGSDAHLFRPQRWLDEEHGRFVPRSAYEFPVFNAGSRACLGRRMAECMAAWVIVRLLADWEFEEVFVDTFGGGGEGVEARSGNKGPPLATGKAERVSQNSLTLPMKDGLPCLVRRRKKIPKSKQEGGIGGG